MNYKINYENQDEDIITRLLKVRGISDEQESFLDPKLNDYWIDSFLLNDMEKGVDRIIKAIKNQEKIMIFGDYDVDGVTSSFCLYRFFLKFLNYKNISVQYPNRIDDGYGLKDKHIDDIKSKGVSLIITVDNGITSINEAIYAKELGLDLIITDHHKNLEKIPEAVAVINPQISENYKFKGLAGVGVAFKLICAIMEKSKWDKDKKNQIFNYFLPIVAIGTVADIVPLVDENRVIVKKGLELINQKKDKIPSSLKGFLKFLNIKDNVDTFHIGFVIGPRINASGRISSPYDSLKILLYSGDKQIKHLEKIEETNTERRKMQEEAIKLAEKIVDHNENIIIVASEDIHEGIVGIVAGRICDKYNKPCMIAKIDQENGNIVASLRGPDYFDIITMINEAASVLLRFGGHKGAGGLSTKLENFDELKQIFVNYCNTKIQKSDLNKILKIDTKIYAHERNIDSISKIERLAPFGEGNQEPVFIIENIKIDKVEKVGKKGNGHLKIHGDFEGQKIISMFRSKGDMEDEINNLKQNKNEINLIGKIKKDNFNGGFS